MARQPLCVASFPSNIIEFSLFNISSFQKCLDSEDKEDLSSELEEGPDPKRRKTFKPKIEKKILDYQKITTNSSQQQLNLNALLDTNISLGMDDVAIQDRQQILPLGSDIGYSSGENNSVHEVIINAQSVSSFLRHEYSDFVFLLSR